MTSINVEDHAAYDAFQALSDKKLDALIDLLTVECITATCNAAPNWSGVWHRSWALRFDGSGDPTSVGCRDTRRFSWRT